MDLLDNPLIRKYFHVGCNDDPCYLAHNHDAMRASLVLCAMQEPIKKGERILVISSSDGSIREEDAVRDCDYIHPFDLRLPDRFQKQECFVSIQRECPQCRKQHVWKIDEESKPTPEPEKCNCTGHISLAHLQECKCCNWNK